MEAENPQADDILYDVLLDHNTNEATPVWHQAFPNIEDGAAAKNRSIKAGKSRNIAKFSLRMFRKQLRNYKRLFRHHPHLFDSLQVKLQALRNWEKSNLRSNALGLAHLHELMGAAEGEAGREGGLARLALSKMVSRCLKEEVLENKRCSHKVLHLNALKFMQLRCMSPLLIARMQIQ